MKKAVLLPTEENLIRTMKEDLLDRNQELSSLCRFLQLQQGMNSIAIDGRWGSGKTFFVKQCALLLNSVNSLSDIEEGIKERVRTTASEKGLLDSLKENVFLAVYYDAWKNDTDEDPVLSLIYEIVQQLNINSGLFDLNKMTTILTSAFNIVTGRDVTEFFKHVQDINLLKNVHKEKKMDLILQEFFVEVLQENCERLVIFVDELDRCRPSFAIRLLERIEHYFVNERITFVFSMNIEQLQHTIKAFYGSDFDACRYLDRFFDVRLSLPTVHFIPFYKSLGLNDNYELDRVIIRVHETFNLSIREFCKYYEAVKMAGMKYDRGDTYNFLFTYIVPLTLALKITNVDLYTKFISGQDVNPLLELYDNNFGRHIAESLLNYKETFEVDKFHSPFNTECIPLTVENKLMELYDAIFVKEYVDSMDRVTMGRCCFDKYCKEMVSNADCLLGEYANCDSYL